MHVDRAWQCADEVSLVSIRDLGPGLLAMLGQLLEQGFRQAGARRIGGVDLHGLTSVRRGWDVVDMGVSGRFRGEV